MKIPSVIMLPANRVWRTYPGGKKLDLMEGSQHPEDTHFAEDWIGSTTQAVNKGREHLTQEGLSTVMIGEDTLTLKALCEKEPNVLLGAAHVAKYGANTQFLLKFLDSAIRLHIQCHPTIPFAVQTLFLK
jgi:mannose-6-phosphate isomerase